jgi:hypothetical protein
MTSDALDLHLTDAQRELYEDTRTAAAQQLKPIADAGEPGRVNRPSSRRSPPSDYSRSCSRPTTRRPSSSV